MTAIDDVVAKFVKPLPEEKQGPVVSRLEEEIAALEKLPKNDFQRFEQYHEAYKAKLKDLQEQLEIAKMAKLGMPLMDITFLENLQSASRLPAFIIVPVEKTEFYLALDARNNEKVNPRAAKKGYKGSKKVTTVSIDFRDYDYLYPEAIHTLYDSVKPQAVSLLNSKVYQNKLYIWISAKIEAGIMPQSMRYKQTLASPLFDRIFLIMEAPAEWKIDQKVVAAGKRILCGWSKDLGKMFFLGSFDPIPVDQYLNEYIKKETE